MSIKKRSVRPVAQAPARYPDAARGFDPSRRRFLRQVAAGSAAAGCCVGVVGRAHATQERVDFSVLEGHDRFESPEPPPAARRSRSAAREENPAGRSADTAEPVVRVEENRAMWLDPGYLVLVRWTRDEDDDTVVAAFEGANVAVQEYLTGAVTTPVSQLHTPEALRTLEIGIHDILVPLLAPASIAAIHLDHSCESVCGLRIEEPDIPHVRGRVAPVRR